MFILYISYFYTHSTISEKLKEEKSEYQKFVSKGTMPEAVVTTWMEIWGNNELNLARTYKADFTIHGKKYYDGDNAEVETFISVNE